jgi:hypothetical protein
VCSNPDGALSWVDYEAEACRACPGATLGCDDFLASPGAGFDSRTRVLTVYVSPGATQIVTATFNGTYSARNADGGPARRGPEIPIASTAC